MPKGLESAMRVGIAGVLVSGLIAVAAAQLATQTEHKNWTLESTRAPIACLQVPVKISLIDERSIGDPTDGRCREGSSTPSVSETRTEPASVPDRTRCRRRKRGGGRAGSEATGKTRVRVAASLAGIRHPAHAAVRDPLSNGPPSGPGQSL